MHLFFKHLWNIHKETIIQVIKRFSRFKVIRSYTVCSLITVESNLKSMTKKKRKKKTLNTEN